MLKTVLRLSVLILALFAVAGLAAEKPGPLPASKPGQQQALPQEAILDDPLGRSTPQGTVLGFMKAVGRDDYERAVEYLDTKQPPKRAQELTRELELILNRGLSANLTKLSKKPEGSLDDTLRPNLEKIGVVKTESGNYDILLDRVQRGNDPPVWLFSSKTLRQVPEIYEELGYHWAEAYIPTLLRRPQVLGQPLWRWIALILGFPVSFLIAWIGTRALRPLFRMLMRRFTERHDEDSVAWMTGPIRGLVLSLVFYLFSLVSNSLLTRLFWSTTAATLATIGIGWLCLRLVDIVVDRMEGRRQMPVSSGRIAIIRLISKLSKGLIVVVGAVFVFYNAGLNFTAVLTGLGVGGIAIAFAAQKTLENLFGGVMIISDQPIRVGDLCRAGDYTGTVEDIGLRSTRLRTLDRTVVSVPNGQLATMSLENFTLRDKIRFHHTLNLRYETSPEQLRHVLAEIRTMLYEHPKVETASARVRLTGFKDSSFELEVFAYVLESEFGIFLEVQEDLLLRIVDIVGASGTSLASPILRSFVKEKCGPQ
jgi:MscS family membrane protein